MADQQVTQTQSSGDRSVARRSDALFPFAPFRRELERMFDDFFSVFGVPARRDGESGQVPAGIVAPRINVTETDDQVRITAELPGVDEKDIDVRLVDDVLTIRAEAQTEHEEKQQDYRVMERARGTFVRSLRLPFMADANQVQASFNNGVLTLTIPKPREARERVQRIEVTRDGAGNGSQSGHQGSSNQRSSNQRSSSGSQSSAEQKASETAAE